MATKAERTLVAGIKKILLESPDHKNPSSGTIYLGPVSRTKKGFAFKLTWGLRQNDSNLAYLNELLDDAKEMLKDYSDVIYRISKGSSQHPYEQGMPSQLNAVVVVPYPTEN